jgi:hypothetical protein
VNGLMLLPPLTRLAVGRLRFGSRNLDPFLTGLLIEKVRLRRTIQLCQLLHTKPPLLI